MREPGDGVILPSSGWAHRCVSIYTGVNGENEEERDIKRLHIGARIDNFYKEAKQNLGLGSYHLRILKGAGSHRLLGLSGYSLLKLRACRSKLYRRIRSDQTIGAECRQAFMDLLQNFVQWVYRNANKLPVNQIQDVILK